MIVTERDPSVDIVPKFDPVLSAHVERLVLEFESQYSREQIERRVHACAIRYRDARITAFVPILVYRDARSALSGGPEPPRQVRIGGADGCFAVIDARPA